VAQASPGSAVLKGTELQVYEDWVYQNYDGVVSIIRVITGLNQDYDRGY
jgi:hypothetical protein